MLPEAETQPIDILQVDAAIPDDPIFDTATPEKFAHVHAKTKPLPGGAEEVLIHVSCSYMHGFMRDFLTCVFSCPCGKSHV